MLVHSEDGFDGPLHLHHLLDLLRLAFGAIRQAHYVQDLVDLSGVLSERLDLREVFGASLWLLEDLWPLCTDERLNLVEDELAVIIV